jgi:hypothetical protein
VLVWMSLSLIETCTPNAHLYRVTYTKCPIYTINSPDDGHMAARNMSRIEMNIHEKELCVKLVIYKDLWRRYPTHGHGSTDVMLQIGSAFAVTDGVGWDQSRYCIVSLGLNFREVGLLVCCESGKWTERAGSRIL